MTAETVADVRAFVTSRLAEGFDAPDDVAAAAVEVFADEADESELEPLARRLTAEAVAALRAEQAAWPEVTDCDRLDAAFDELTAAGVVCRQNFTCCGTCGNAEIGGELAAEEEAGARVRGYAFYHMQGTESAAEGHGLYLSYGAVEAGEAAALAVAGEVVAGLRKHGLTADWNGRWDTCVHVSLDWKRRLPFEVIGGEL